MKAFWVFAMALAAAGAPARPCDDDDPGKLLKDVGYTLVEAIQKSTAIAKEGTVLEAGLENEDGKVVYYVEFAQEKKVLEISLDAKTGDVVKQETEDEDKSDVAKACKVTLSQAIATALQKVPGQAMEAEAEVEDGKCRIEVKIFSDGKVYKVELDGETGVVLKVKTKKSGEKKEEKKGHED